MGGDPRGAVGANDERGAWLVRWRVYDARCEDADDDVDAKGKHSSWDVKRGCID
jgi:hypothetical protein